MQKQRESSRLLEMPPLNKLFVKERFLRACVPCPGTVLGAEDLAGQTSACLSAWKLYKENGRDRRQQNRQIKQSQTRINALKEIKGVRWRMTNEGVEGPYGTRGHKDDTKCAKILQ